MVQKPRPPTRSPEARAAGSRTLTAVIDELENAGYDGQFRPVGNSEVQCLTCHTTTSARRVTVGRLDRIEGASDPADMAMVVGLTCPRCYTRGTLVLMYGPDAPIQDAELLLQFDTPDVPPNEPA